MTSRQDDTSTVNLRKYVEVRLMGDKPHIRRRRLPVSMIAYAARDNDLNIAELTEAFDLSEAQVLAGLLYYKENQTLIDDQEKAEAARATVWATQDEDNDD